MNYNRLVLTEALTDKNMTNVHAEMHVVDLLGLPVGIVKRVTNQNVEVVVSGEVKNMFNLEPGKKYYATNLGDIIEGEYTGERNTESYYIYHESKKVVVSDDNCVGVALDDNTFVVKTKS